MMAHDVQGAAFRTMAGKMEDLTPSVVDSAEREATSRGVPVSRLLDQEHNVSRKVLLDALAAYYGCPAIEYDERLPVPPELLLALSNKNASIWGWFPVIKDSDGTVIVAVVDPTDATIHAEVEEIFPSVRIEYRVALPDDIQWYIQDFLHAPPGKLVGTERTGHAFWRNNMAQWRTRLACYRTDMAKARTSLVLVRDGLAFTAIAATLLRSDDITAPAALAYGILAVGILMLVSGIPPYLKVRRSRLTPPRNQTLVEVTAATLMFLEGYHFIEHDGGVPTPTKATMLARLGDLLANYCTILYPSPGSQERTHLARERNVLAAQRTIGACYRTIYSRARTGLSFVRTGVSFMSIGIGLMTYFGLNIHTLFDGMVILFGLLMVIDGLFWYMPVRKEQAELPRTRSAVLAQ